MPDTPDTTEPEDLIRYDILAQEALRGVVKKVLQEVARTGLPGDHHFYITFDTNFAGVRMSSRMREKYPDEMTIVVQHQFWDLETTDHGFSIGLSFDNIPESMLIPYSAIRGFFDPSVQFGLQFEAVVEDADTGAETAMPEIESSHTPVSALPSPKAKTAPKAEVEPDAGKADGEDDASDADEEDENPSADVVSLDAFRKK
ncbi:MAG: ClpXP protease specificity-enhancing factor SspB [Pseudomonadota bacterium]